MKQPWKTIRSFGIYAPSRQWGWDMSLVASMRIANEDNGYGRGALEDFVEEGDGFLVWIPKKFHAPLDEQDGWESWLVKQMSLCRNSLRDANIYLLCGHLIITALVNLYMLFRRRGRPKSQRRPNMFLGALVRLGVTHGVLALVFYFALQSIQKSQWAENVRHGKPFCPLPPPSRHSRDVFSSQYNTHRAGYLERDAISFALSCFIQSTH